MICDNCNFAGLFHCAHPKRYIQPFKQEDSCELYQKGEPRTIINNTVVCSKCGKVVNINDCITEAKGSKFICKECIK